MTEFSTTRLADQATAYANNAHLAPAILWLKSNTPIGRLSDLEVYEAIVNATTNGGFAITVSSNSIPCPWHPHRIVSAPRRSTPRYYGSD